MEDNVRVIDRTLDILEVLSSSEGPVSLAEICSCADGLLDFNNKK